MHKIVILGGGFGGIRCALDLSRLLGDEVEITLIDRAHAHQFTPALYEVASAYREVDDSALLKLRRSVSIAYGEIFSGTRVTHVLGEVTAVDLSRRIVTLHDGEERTYDYCVMALGSQSTDYGILGVTENTYFFKTLHDALKVNQRVHQLFREYIHGPRDKQLQILLAGAGFTGIELASELACCLSKLGRKEGIHKKFFSIMVFEAASQMMPMLTAKERSSLMKRLVDIGVGTSDHSPIESVHADHVQLADGHVWRGDMVIWTAGVKPNVLLASIPTLPLTSHGKISVDTTLQAHGLSNVFGIGDAAEYIDPKTQQGVPMLAYNAFDQGSIAARNIVALIQNKKLREYHPRTSSWVAPVGARFAIAHIGNTLSLIGFFGWFAKWIIDFRYFVSILPFSRATKLLKKDFLLFSQND